MTIPSAAERAASSEAARSWPSSTATSTARSNASASAPTRRRKPRGSGTSRKIASAFYIARPDVDTSETFTPGIYGLTNTLRITRPNTIVLGLGFATLRGEGGVIAMSTADVDGLARIDCAGRVVG